MVNAPFTGSSKVGNPQPDDLFVALETRADYETSLNNFVFLKKLGVVAAVTAIKRDHQEGAGAPPIIHLEYQVIPDDLAPDSDPEFGSIVYSPNAVRFVTEEEGKRGIEFVAKVSRQVAEEMGTDFDVDVLGVGTP